MDDLLSKDPIMKKMAAVQNVAMFLSSGDPDMYDGARFSYEGDFLGYLGLEDMGIITNHDTDYLEVIQAMAEAL